MDFYINFRGKLLMFFCTYLNRHLSIIVIHFLLFELIFLLSRQLAINEVGIGSAKDQS